MAADLVVPEVAAVGGGVRPSETALTADAGGLSSCSQASLSAQTSETNVEPEKHTLLAGSCPLPTMLTCTRQ